MDEGDGFCYSKFQKDAYRQKDKLCSESVMEHVEKEKVPRT